MSFCRIERLCKRGGWHRGTRHSLRYTIEVPQIEGADRINHLYASIAERCETFCQRSLKERIKDMAVGSYIYDVSCFCSHNDGETVSFALRARLSRDGCVESERIFAHTWEADCEEMIPPHQLADRYGGNKRDKGECMLLKDGKIYVMRAEEYDVLRRKYRIGSRKQNNISKV